MQYKDKIFQMVAKELNVLLSEVTLEAEFYNDLFADSLDMIEVWCETEKIIGKEIPSEAFLNCKTVGELINLIYVLTRDKTAE